MSNHKIILYVIGNEKINNATKIIEMHLRTGDCIKITEKKNRVQSLNIKIHNEHEIEIINRTIEIL